MSRYTRFTKLKHLIFLNGGSTIQFDVMEDNNLAPGSPLLAHGGNVDGRFGTKNIEGQGGN
jgi:hypothetical protein